MPTGDLLPGRRRVTSADLASPLPVGLLGASVPASVDAPVLTPAPPARPLEPFNFVDLPATASFGEIFDRSVPWDRLDLASWPAPHFLPEEWACEGTGRVFVQPRMLAFCERLRERNGGRPITLTSGYRSPWWNAELRRRGVRTATRSWHMTGLAGDFRVDDHDPHALIRIAVELGAVGVGAYPNSARPFLHFDLRPGGRARWGDPFPERQVYPGATPPTRYDAERQASVEAVEAQRSAKRSAANGTAGAIVAGGVGSSAIVHAATDPSVPLDFLLALGTYGPPVAILIAALAFLYFYADDVLAWFRRRYAGIRGRIVDVRDAILPDDDRTGLA